MYEGHIRYGLVNQQTSVDQVSSPQLLSSSDSSFGRSHILCFTLRHLHFPTQLNSTQLDFLPLPQTSTMFPRSLVAFFVAAVTMQALAGGYLSLILYTFSTETVYSPHPTPVR
jgi:hypothetical protein